jgi:hypothetical protein
MAKHRETQPTVPPAPELFEPPAGAIIDGHSVAFRWGAAEGALEYRLEVATDSWFEQIVFTEVVQEARPVVVSNLFETDDQLYYWRVLARNEVGWSHGEVIESFISSTAENATYHFHRPDVMERLGPLTELITGGSHDVLYLRSQRLGTPGVDLPEVEEDLGPAAALFRAASVEAAADVTHEAQYYDQEHQIGVEHEGVEAKQILAIVAAIALAIVLMAITIFQFTNRVEAAVRQRLAAEASYPELREAEAQAAERLGQYGIVDDAQGVYRIPIDRAMELMVNQAQQAPGGPYSSELQLLPRGQQPAPPAGEEPLQGEQPQGQR